MEVGVLALHGAFREHRKLLKDCGVASREIRKPEQLTGIAGLIIPGGESTTIGKLMLEFDLMEPVKRLALEGFPVFGVSGGLVVMARNIRDSSDPRLGIMDMEVVRNGFEGLEGLEDSFEIDLQINAVGMIPFHGVFISAPYISKVNPNVGILASLEDKIVFARQGNLLACAFHPELTDDTRVHQYFLDIVRQGR